MSELDLMLQKNMWSLDKKTLRQFVNLSHKSNSSLNTKQFRTDKHISIPLRSSLNEEVFYEVLVTKPKGDVYINICYMKHDEKDSPMERAACIYHNDVVLRWGGWITELLYMLPEMMGGLFKKYGDFCMCKLVDEGIIDEYESSTADRKFKEAENLILKEVYAKFGQEVAEEVYGQDNSGRPLRAVRTGE
jgi:hypothetical protein